MWCFKKFVFLCLWMGWGTVCPAAFFPELSGRVISEGRGVEGVAVTDGYTVVRTDARGRYRLPGNSAAEFVYITLPAGYEVPLRDEVPCFFRRINKAAKKQKFDFYLQKSRRNDDRHVVVVAADPQVYFDEELPALQKIADDMQSWVAGKYGEIPVYGMVAGDVIGDIQRNPGCFGAVKHILYHTQIPFFYTAGNHDLDRGGRSNERSRTMYAAHFGPAYYSFNRGRVHYIVLDGVFALGKDYLYTGYLAERQLEWLEQDLALVPEGSPVVVLTHIPTYSREARSGNYAKERTSQVINNRAHLYDLLKSYRVQILSGHTHYHENYVIADNLYEHVHASLCGLFWQAPWCGDGTPIGYTVYEMDGDSISWYFKPVGDDRSYQFRAYAAGENDLKPEALTVNVWNYDPSWKIYWYEDGERMGEMERYTGIDPVIDSYVVSHRKSFKYDYIGAEPTEHLFFAIPRSAGAAIRVEATDRFGNVYSGTPRKVEEWLNDQSVR